MTTWREFRKAFALQLGEPVHLQFPDVKAQHSGSVGQILHDDLPIMFDVNSLRGSIVFKPSTGEHGIVKDVAGNAIIHTGGWSLNQGEEFEVWSIIHPQTLFTLTNSVIGSIYPWQFVLEEKQLVYPKYDVNLKNIIPTTWKFLATAHIESFDRVLLGDYNISNVSGNVLTVDNVNWSTDEYKDWEIGVVSGAETGAIYTVSSNTSNTITLSITPTSIVAGDNIVLKEPVDKELSRVSRRPLLSLFWERASNTIILDYNTWLSGRTVYLTGEKDCTQFTMSDTSTTEVPLELLLAEVHVNVLKSVISRGGQFSVDDYKLSLQLALQERDSRRRQFAMQPIRMRFVHPRRQRGRRKRSNPFAV